MTLAIINMSTPLPNHPGNNGIAPNSTIVSNWVNVSSMYQLTAIISQVNSPGTIYIDQSNDQITYTSVSSAYTELEQLTTSASSQYARIRVVTGSGYTNSGYAYLSGTTAISGAIIDNGGQVFNVLAYGAKGDGVTDDTAVIQAAINAALVNGGKIYLPQGTYLVDGTLSITNALNPVSITGPGTLRLINNAANNSSIVSVVNSPNVTVSCNLDQNGQNQTVTYVYGIRYDVNSPNLIIKDCRMINVWGFIVTSSGGGPTAQNKNVTVANNTVIYMPSASHDGIVITSNGGSCYGNTVYNSGSAIGINIYESNNVPTFGNTVYGTNTGGAMIGVSSSMESPVFGNTLVTGGTNDIGIKIAQETDNSNSRAQTDGKLFGNYISGGGNGITVGSSSQTNNSLSNLSIINNSFLGCFSNIVYNYYSVISDVLVSGNMSSGVGSGGYFVYNSVPSSYRHQSNIGYNPTGPQTAPTMPASGTALTNPFPFDCTVYIAGGTVTAIAVDGATTGLTSGPFFIAAGSSITLTYSVAPTTFEWIGN